MRAREISRLESSRDPLELSRALRSSSIRASTRERLEAALRSIPALDTLEALELDRELRSLERSPLLESEPLPRYLKRLYTPSRSLHPYRAIDLLELPRYLERLDAILHLEPRAALEGRAWYPERLEEMRELEERTSIPFELLSAALSALSPRLLWSRNLEALERVLSILPRYRAGESARALLDGAIEGIGAPAGMHPWRLALELLDRAPLDPLELLSGSKCRAFYRSIARGGSTLEVAIDSHASIAARAPLDRGRRAGVTSSYGEIEGDRVYDTLSLAYALLSSRLEVDPPVVQSSIWSALRSLPLASRRG